MNIALFAGELTKILEDKLVKSSAGAFELVGCYEDIELGLEKLLGSGISFDKILLMENAKELNGEVFNIEDLFKNLADIMQSEFFDKELVYTTTNKADRDIFEAHFSMCNNCKMYYAESLTIKLVTEMLLNRYVEPVDSIKAQEKTTVTKKPEVEKQKKFDLSKMFGKKDQQEPKIKEVKQNKQKAIEPVAVPVVQEVKPIEVEVEPAVAPVVTQRESVEMQPVYQEERPSNLKEILRRNRVILVTGDRGAGSTSTACNIAKFIADNGGNTILIDLDLVGKGTSLYFDELNKLEHDDNFNTSLLNAANNISNCGNYIASCRNGLGILGLPLSINEYDKRLKAINNEKVHTMVQYLHTHYSTVIIDCPVENIHRFNSLITTCTNILFCTGNSHRAIFNTARYFQPQFFKEALSVLDGSTDMGAVLFDVLRNKTSFVLTNFRKESEVNGRVIDERLIVQAVSDISGSVLKNTVATTIPSVGSFDNQSYKSMLCDDKKLSKCFADIVSNIYKS